MLDLLIVQNLLTRKSVIMFEIRGDCELVKIAEAFADEGAPRGLPGCCVVQRSDDRAPFFEQLNIGIVVLAFSPACCRKTPDFAALYLRHQNFRVSEAPPLEPNPTKRSWHDLPLPERRVFGKQRMSCLKQSAPR
jgi:hypothetical protein